MATRHPLEDPIGEVTRLANRAAALAFASAFSLIVALVALPGALSQSGGPVRRVAALAALIVAAAVLAWAWRGRARLRAARRRSEVSASSPEGQRRGGDGASRSGGVARADGARQRGPRPGSRPRHDELHSP